MADYKDISAQASNLSEADIRKVWETVAEDYAPFNVNVTTVQPASFANNVAVRVVIAGDMTAKLVNGPRRSVSVSGDRFIADITERRRQPGRHVGLRGIDSFTNSEPNVVYVFGKYLSTWGTTSPEGAFAHAWRPWSPTRPRTKPATASACSTIRASTPAATLGLPRRHVADDADHGRQHRGRPHALVELHVGLDPRSIRSSG